MSESFSMGRRAEEAEDQTDDLLIAGLDWCFGDLARKALATPTWSQDGSLLSPFIKGYKHAWPYRVILEPKLDDQTEKQKNPSK